MRNNKNKGDGLPMGIVYDLIKAFVVGGLICVVGQILIDLTKMTPAKILVAFVVIGVSESFGSSDFQSGVYLFYEGEHALFSFRFFFIIS